MAIRLALAALSCLAFTACSLQTFEQQDCSSDDACIVSFGAGSSCNAGFCSRPSSCNNDERCLSIAAGSTCENGRCTPPEPCATDEECATSFGLGSTCGPGYCVGNTPCTDIPDCTAAFGWTSTCEAGVCVEVPDEARCRLTWPTDLFTSDQYNDWIAIGQLFNLSEHAIEGRAAQTVVRRINAQGGINGRNLALVQCDQGDREDTVAVTRFLARIGAPVIVGAMNSDATETAFDSAAAIPIPIITPAAGATSLTDRRVGENRARPIGSQPGYLFRTIHTDDTQADVIVQQFRSEGYQNVGIIYRLGAYGDDMQNLLVQRLVTPPRIDAQPIAFGTALSAIDSELMAAVADMPANQPDIVLFASPDSIDYILFLDLISREDADPFWSDIPIWLTDVGFNRQLRNQMNPRVYELFENIKGSRPAPSTETPLYLDFLTQYDAIHGNRNDPQTTAYSATTFDATWLAALGIARMIATEESSEPRGLRVARGVKLALGGEGTPIAMRASNMPSMLDRLIENRPFQVEGASGDLIIDDETNQLMADSARIEIWRLAAPGEPGCEQEETRPCFVIISSP